MISVCIATYNGEKYILSQIQSIIPQLDVDDEIIVSDDGSFDKTIELIQNLNDTRIRIITSPQFFYDIKTKEFGVIPRVSRNFFYAIKQAKGDTIYLSDQDDVWHKDKIKICEARLSEADMVIHRRTDVDYNLNPLSDKNNSLSDNRKINPITVFTRPPFQGACMGFTNKVRDLLIENLNLISHSPLSHDHILGFTTWILLGKKRITFINDRLIDYRRHGENVSSTGEKSQHNLLFKIRYRFEVCNLLIKLLFQRIFNRKK